MKVSVILTHYEQHSMLQQAVDSLVDQTRLPDEVILIDDGSEAPPMPRFKNGGNSWKLRMVEHRGVGATLNRAVEEVTGDVVCWLPADDWWKPGKLERQLEFHAKHSDCISHSYCDVYDGDDNFLHVGRVPPLSDEEMRTAVRTSSPYYASTFMIPREVLHKVGPFREDVLASEDYEWVLRSVVHCGVGYRLQEESLTIKRVHGGSNTSHHGHLIPDLVKQFNREVDELIR
jgi:glycosyltransferase involved in cell wall biosynthesis